nr:RNA directed DNA polymerase [Hymenolepis microstoma]
MLKSIPGTLRNSYDQGNLLNRRNMPLTKSDVKAVFRKILQPTRFKLSELLDEPVIGESLNQIITLSPKWRRYIDRVATFRNGQGSADHGSVYGILKEYPARLIKELSLPVCRSHLILKPSGKLRLISIPTAFKTRFKRAGGLVEFFYFLHDQAPFTFRPSLPDVSLSFKALSNFRSLFPTNQTFFLGRIDIADCFNNIDHKLLLEAFKEAVSKAEQFTRLLISREHIISELSYFLNNYIIRLGERCYQQTKGIPQGSCVSTDLSNLFLAFVDRKSSLKGYLWDAEKRTPPGAKAPEAAILRFHDDYLLVATSKERLLDIRSDLNGFGLKSNVSKESIITDGVGPEFVEWLGLEITPRLDLLMPKVNKDKLIFERFGGYPLPWKQCLFRIKSSLQTSLLIKLVVKQADFTSNSSLAEENARRIGLQFGHILLTYVWSCPERQKFLTSFKHCRHLAKIMLCRLAFVFKDASLLSLARDHLIQILQRRRNNFKTLLRCIYKPWLVLSVISKKSSCMKILSQFSNSLRTHNQICSADE